MRFNTEWNKKTKVDKAVFVFKILLSVAAVASAISGFTNLLAMNQAFIIMYTLLALLLATNGFESRKQVKVLSYLSYGVALFLLIVVVKKWMEM